MCLKFSPHSLSIWPERTEGSICRAGRRVGEIAQIQFQIIYHDDYVQIPRTNGMGVAVDVGRIENNFTIAVWLAFMVPH